MCLHPYIEGYNDFGGMGPLTRRRLSPAPCVGKVIDLRRRIVDLHIAWRLALGLRAPQSSAGLLNLTWIARGRRWTCS